MNRLLETGKKFLGSWQKPLKCAYLGAGENSAGGGDRHRVRIGFEFRQRRIDRQREFFVNGIAAVGYRERVLQRYRAFSISMVLTSTVICR